RFIILYSFHHSKPNSFPTRRSSDLKTAINERKREKQEFSIKLMELHENRNKQYLNKIYLLSEFDIELDVEQGQQNMLYNFTKTRSEEHTSELQSRFDIVCRLLLEKK